MGGELLPFTGEMIKKRGSRPKWRWRRLGVVKDKKDGWAGGRDVLYLSLQQFTCVCRAGSSEAVARRGQRVEALWRMCPGVYSSGWVCVWPPLGDDKVHSLWSCPGAHIISSPRLMLGQR